RHTRFSRDWSSDVCSSDLLDMPKELQAESLAFVCALNDAGNVGDHEAPVIAQTDYTQIGRECGEWVIGDLRPGGGDYGEESALRSEERRVGEGCRVRGWGA